MFVRGKRKVVAAGVCCNSCLPHRGTYIHDTDVAKCHVYSDGDGDGDDDDDDDNDDDDDDDADADADADAYADADADPDPDAVADAADNDDGTEEEEGMFFLPGEDRSHNSSKESDSCL